MNLEPWYKVVTPRQEVREGRSFSPDEFAIHLDQVVSGTAPEDYRQPRPFFARTCFTAALTEHLCMVLRRLAGETANTAPVLSLVTQFGGGKTHTLTALYHLARNSADAASYPGVAALLEKAGLSVVPGARVAVFVGNAWDPQPGRETPWIDVARQLAGDKGVELLGPAASSTPPGTEALGRVFAAAGGSVLILFDEVLNFVNRYRGTADQFYAFVQNLTVAMTGTTHSAAVVSLPRSQVEMTEWDLQWQERITKVVRRVARDLIALDEAEIAEVLRQRLFEDLGDGRVRRQVAALLADWCYQYRAQLPAEWTAVDTAATEAHARDFLRSRFEACYPFHPATLSVFQRKWQALPQYQQTRGTLAMLAQWIAEAYRAGFTHARQEPLITLGSSPLEVRGFRSLVLGQIGEQRLETAIEVDVAGQMAHARALDVDTKGALQGIHRRVGTAIFFESSGGQVDRVAHLPELRFALGDPEVDTTSVDNAALALERKGFYLRRVGSDGFRIHHKPTLKKVMSDRRASLDWNTEVKPAMEKLVRAEFDRGRTIPMVAFPAEGSAVPDSPRLSLVVLSPDTEWGSGSVREQIAQWSRQHGSESRLHPAALIWCARKPGRDLRDAVENWLAWQRVEHDMQSGLLGEEFDRGEQTQVYSSVKEADADARDEVWASYRFVLLADNQEPDGLKVIDLGAGHSSTGETLCGRVIAALKSQALLNESVGAGYIERHWPPALKESGAWPLVSLRKSFLDGSLTRLLDPDAVLPARIVEFVNRGDFGLASGQEPDGTYERVWYEEPVGPEEVAFESGLFLLAKARALALKAGPPPAPEAPPQPVLPVPAIGGRTSPTPGVSPGPQPPTVARQLRLFGTIPPEVWNRLGTRVIPKLRSGTDVQIGIQFSVSVNAESADACKSELRQILADLGLTNQVQIEG